MDKPSQSSPLTRTFHLVLALEAAKRLGRPQPSVEAAAVGSEGDNFPTDFPWGELARDTRAPVTTPLPKVTPLNFSAKNNFSPKEARALVGQRQAGARHTRAAPSLPLQAGRFSLGPSSCDPRGAAGASGRGPLPSAQLVWAPGAGWAASPRRPAAQRGPGRD